MVLIQIIIGGIGFPLIYDVIEKINYRRKGLTYKLTLFSKVALISYFAVGILTAAAAFGFEFGYAGYQNVSQVDLNGKILPDLPPVPIYDIAHYKEMANEFGKNETFNKC
jgi:Trk-type K+ transport system membrane component